MLILEYDRTFGFRVGVRQRTMLGCLMFGFRLNYRRRPNFEKKFGHVEVAYEFATFFIRSITILGSFWKSNFGFGPKMCIRSGPFHLFFDWAGLKSPFSKLLNKILIGRKNILFKGKIHFFNIYITADTRELLSKNSNIFRCRNLKTIFLILIIMHTFIT